MSSLEKPIFPRDERGSDSPLPEVLARDFFARLGFRQGGWPVIDGWDPRDKKSWKFENFAQWLNRVDACNWFRQVKLFRA